MTSFRDASSLERLARGRFRASADASWAQGRGLYGGLVAALLARALEAEAPSGQRIARMTVCFTAPFAAGAAMLSVSTVRTARNVSCMRAEIANEGADAPAASCLATLARPRPSAALVHHGLVPPPVPAPDEVPDGPGELYFPAFASRFEFRQCLGPRPFSGGAQARVGGWCRSREGAPFDPALVVALLDAWSPAAVGVSPGWCPVASLEMTVHFLVPLPHTRASGWLLYDASCDHAEGGLADERAVIFDQHGTPLATAQQLVALLPGAERPT
ncbi:MAG: thioesterase family protein [Sandaracinaceae bacterium]|nr:thioesterase family protein [Sandaracinaceae bacterium]